MKKLEEIKIDFPQRKIKCKSRGASIYFSFKTIHGTYNVLYNRVKKNTWEFSRIERQNS